MAGDRAVKPLAERTCAACGPGTPALEAGAVDALLPQVPGWAAGEIDGHPVLARRYGFKGFMPAIGFVNRVAAIAERERHHPDLLVGWGYVTVRLWTHAAEGLTENDFILAAKIDLIEPTKS